MDEDKTRVIHRPLQTSDATHPAEAPDTEKTRTVQVGDRSPAPPSEKTVLIGRPARSAGAPSGSADAAAPGDASLDPVVGWLVVIKGPGRGNALRLGHGWNTMGRDAGQRVRLDFGDAQISRVNHAKFLYDPRARKFTITQGDGLNPTYVRGEALIAPTEINTHDVIQVGETELMFVALCGKDFDWQDQA